ncbi:MAG TPA: GIY-YIG nuclease family protein [Ignavibacteria bacterium]|nr:excinuclease ABC subunit C [Bacteroidota bacterium]HRE11988.1 GIY-YIG nuclease family protein [Ignavibacteria bacterium]HRF65780.1 GIY-YIG nuclease family protein [Ignavibacteria bacterium]HRJ03232.1 GIY-YIG nuclease family protein [Ignavibacteria bacterium]HRJ85156.1 GIY-YIG nuclease family protein [Ignavibacteria bacterium]
MNQEIFAVYILTNKYNRVLYTGFTINLYQRVLDHKNKTVKSFSSRYNVYKLVYYEFYANGDDARERERQLKGGSRQKKIDLINKLNPNWDDLFDALSY